MDFVYAYERDPYLGELQAEVVASGEEAGRPFVVLDDTILYPEGGGQPADRGRIGGVAVEDVRTVADRIRHVLAGPAPGGRVRVTLDWARRFDHMQQHTAQHLITALAADRFGWQTTAFHLGSVVSDVELDTPRLAAEALRELEEAVAAEVRAARPVTGRRVSPDEYAALPVRTRGLPEGHAGAVRLVEIAGIDLNTCGGTHLGSTAEIEGVKLLGTEGMRGGTRLFYAAGTRLRRLFAAHHERMAALRQLLGTSDDELAAGVQARLEQLKEAQRSVRALEEELALTAGTALAAAGDRVVSAHFPARELPFLQRVAREFARLAPDRTILLTAGEAEQGAFVLAAGEAATLDLPAAGKRVAEILAGRGGGSGRIYQGKAAALSRRVEAAAALVECTTGHGEPTTNNGK